MNTDSSQYGAAPATKTEGSPQDWSSVDSNGMPHSRSTNGTSNNNNNEQKRNKACEHCRSLKVRCITNPEDPSAPCVRCQKAKRECIFHFGPRKRTKRADKVAALEKKLEYLTNALQKKDESGSIEADGNNHQNFTTQTQKQQQQDKQRLNGLVAPLTNSRPPSGPAPIQLQQGIIAAGNQPIQLQELPPIQFSENRDNNPQQQLPAGPAEFAHHHQQHQLRQYRTGSQSSGVSPNSTSSTPQSSLRRQISRKGDTKHPSINSTPEELEFGKDGQSQFNTGINVEQMREEMAEVWNKLVDKSSKRLEYLDSLPVSKVPNIDNDIIAQGILSQEDAEKRLDTYTQKFYPNYPLIQLPTGYTVDQLRKEYPVLFLVVMSITSLLCKNPDVGEKAMILYNSACETVIYETMMVGTKSFELVQCLILLSFWYNEPELYHQQKCHLLSNLAVGIATDLGINGTHHMSTKTAAIRYERIVRPQVLADPRTLECRRLWLAVYCSTINISVVVRRPMYSLWSKYTEECCDMIEQSDENEEYKRIAVFARLSHVFEDIARVMDPSDGANPPPVSESKVHYLIKYFERMLESVYNRHPVPRLEPYKQAIQIYLHQAALYVPFDPQLGRAPFSEYSLAIGRLRCTPEVITCALWCYTSCVNSLDQFLAMDNENVALLPLFGYTRMIFAAAMLLKLRTLCVTNPDFNATMSIGIGELKRLFEIQDRLQEISNTYMFANQSVNYLFVLKLLMCHHDRQLYHFFDTQGGSSTQNSNNQHTLKQSADQKQQPQQQRKVGRQHSKPAASVADGNGTNSSPQKHHPGSPLDILSSVAEQQQQPTSAVGPNASANQNQPQMQPHQLASSIQQGVSSTDVPQQSNGASFPMTTGGTTAGGPYYGPVYGPQSQDDDYPYWLMGDDFWKDLVPNVEAFTGYDIM